MLLQKLHHVAYRCTNAAETVDFYTKFLGLELVHALTNDRLPSTGVFAPHIHIFFAMADGSFIAFFEVPLADAAQPDKTGAAWG
jgi:catechol 2,3-dioxygenase-like lactoylglutathione lyase family enzyme